MQTSPISYLTLTPPARKAAFDTIKESLVSFPATFHTSAAHASNLDNDKTILQCTAQGQPLPYSDPKTDWPTHPLPVNITTPVNIPRFALLLRHHPDPGMVRYLIDGLTNGFDIGASEVPTSSRPKNHRLALDHPEEVTKAIVEELKNGHIAGPFTSPPLV